MSNVIRGTVSATGAVKGNLGTVFGKDGKSAYEVAVKNTAGLMVIVPLVIMYCFCQRKLVQGIEHSGLGGT